MDFVIYAIDKPNSADLRRQVRAPHLEFVAGYQQHFCFGGPLLGPDGQTRGSVMVVHFEDRAALDRYMAQDPYYTCGLFESVAVWPTRQIVPETAPGQLQQEIERQREMARAAPSGQA